VLALLDQMGCLTVTAEEPLIDLVPADALTGFAWPPAGALLEG
jgi:hypothetical protein